MRVMLHAGARVMGGLLAHVSTLSAGLAREGHDVHLLLAPDQAIDPVAQGCRAAGASVTRLEVRGKGDLPGMLALGRLVRAWRPEIFHAHLASPVEAIPALLVAARAGAGALVTTEHAPTWHPLERPWSGAARRLAARSIGAVIALCESDASYLMSRFGVPASLLRVIPNGVELPRPLPSKSEARARLGLAQDRERDFVVGYAGALEPKKGIRDLLQAAGSLGPGLTLWLAGAGSLEGELRALARTAPFGLHLAGFVPEMGRCLPGLDLFVLPSHQEAMPLALLEAMAAGLPVVATRVGGIPEAVDGGNAGLLVAPREPGELAGAIRLLRDDPARREALGRAAAARSASLYTAARMVGAVASLYRELAGGQQANGNRGGREERAGTDSR